MTTFVLVPGGWHGGWNFRPVTERLRDRGHTFYELTLSGVGDRSHLPAGTINLDTHVEDVVHLFEQEDIRHATLVGHSHGGMVIAGVADRVHDRIERLVYLDAYVPADGESCFDLFTPAFQRFCLEGARRDGCSVQPPAGLDPRATPHPAAAFFQAASLSGRQNDVARRDFVYHSGWQGTPFTPFYERLRADPTWHVHVVPCGHDGMSDEYEPLSQSVRAALEHESVDGNHMSDEARPSDRTRDGPLG